MEISNWFKGFEKGIARLSPEERSAFFSECGKNCVNGGTLSVYKKLYEDAKGNMDVFFQMANDLPGVKGEVVEEGHVYRLIFLKCTCELCKKGYVTTPLLCECSRQSVIYSLHSLWKDKNFIVTLSHSILGGGTDCEMRIEVDISMTLRPFTIDDAPIILSWIKDRTAFRKWSADRYPAFPPKPEEMVAQYAADNIFPFTAIDDEGKIVGHIMLRNPDSSKTVIRFGFVIVDDNLRGKGYGKQMLQLAIQKAMNEYGAKKISLGVFDNNPSAFHCYESVGFMVIGTDSYFIDGEEWTEKEMEINCIQ